VRERLVQVPMHCIFISVVTEAELLYGVAKRDYPKGLTKRVTEFLARVEVLPWTSDVAKAYGSYVLPAKPLALHWHPWT